METSKNCRTLLLVPVIVLIIVGLLTFVALYLYSWHKTAKERSELSREISVVYEKQGREATRVLLMLVHQYLSEEKYGRYAERLDRLNNYFGMESSSIALSDSYQSIMSDLASNELMLWAMGILLDRGGSSLANNYNEQQELLKTTPQKLIFEMLKPLASMGHMHWRLYDGDFSGNDKLESAKQEFEKQKTKLERAIDFAKSAMNVKVK